MKWGFVLHFTSGVQPFSVATPEHHNICLRLGKLSCGQLHLDVSQQKSKSSISDSFNAPTKTGCMAQSQRRPLHLPSSRVPEPLCPGNCGGGHELCPRLVEGHVGELMDSGGWRLIFVWSDCYFQILA